MLRCRASFGSGMGTAAQPLLIAAWFAVDDGCGAGEGGLWRDRWWERRAEIGLEALHDREAFGAWIEKSMYGRKYMGIDRSTFLIDKDGKIVREWTCFGPFSSTVTSSKL